MKEAHEVVNEKVVALPNKKTARIKIWDTLGQDKFNCVPPLFYKGTAGAFIVMDLSDP